MQRQAGQSLSPSTTSQPGHWHEVTVHRTDRYTCLFIECSRVYQPSGGYSIHTTRRKVWRHVRHGLRHAAYSTNPDRIGGLRVAPLWRQTATRYESMWPYRDFDNSLHRAVMVWSKAVMVGGAKVWPSQAAQEKRRVQWKGSIRRLCGGR